MFHVRSSEKKNDQTCLHEIYDLKTDEPVIEKTQVPRSITFSNHSNIATVDSKKIRRLCAEKRIQAFLLNVQDLDQTRIVIDSVTEISSEIFFKYVEYNDVFFKEKAHELSQHEFHDHAIETEENILFESIYNLSMTKLNALREYLNEQLIKNYIVSSKSSIDASILFVKKKDDDLRLCVDYRDLNAVTIKNRYSLSLIQELIEVLIEAIVFIKFDIRNAFNSIRIKVDDE